jgi:hypothetical protein
MSTLAGDSPRNRRPLAALVFALLLLLTVGGMVAMAFGFAEQARRIPLVVGGPTVALILLQLGRLILQRPDPSIEDDDALAATAAELADADEAENHGGTAETEVADDAPAPAREAAAIRTGEGASPLIATAWVLLLAVMVLAMGLLITVPLFAFAFMRIYGREPWWVIAVSTSALLVVIYGFFIRVLEIRVFSGFLAEWFA